LPAWLSNFQFHRLALLRFVVHFREAGWSENRRKLLDRVNAYLMSPLFNRRRFAAFQATHVGACSGHYYIIVVPGTLHFLLPCLNLVHGRTRILLIDNGLDGWERRFLRARFPEVPLFKLRLVAGSLLPHGHALNLLIAGNKQNFGVFDHDAYIFRPGLLEDYELGDDESLAALWGYWNREAAVSVNRTYFMYFNVRKLKSVMNRYGIGMQPYQRLSPRLWRALAPIGFNPDNVPKDYIGVFDTTDAVVALCRVRGSSPRFVVARPEDAMHIGGTSRKSGVYLTYMSLRFLEYCDDKALSDRYLSRFAPLMSSQDVLSGLVAEDARRLESMATKLFARISAAMAGAV